MTYYGRWTYKYESATRKGAAAAIIVHETGPAGYPWEVVSGKLGPRELRHRAAGRRTVACRSRAGSPAERARELFLGGGPGLRRAQARPRHQRLQAACRLAPRRSSTSGTRLRTRRVAQRGRQARGQRPDAEERVRHLHARTGITSDATPTAQGRPDLQRRARQRVRDARGLLEIARRRSRSSSRLAETLACSSSP